ncbi:hypothetical protein [Actinomadura opuntiae]|uniref:hypothetical protein n=1 Tax=Actinomadura sp. OS1-43 TaxID=604315 RepID=UPI00255A7DE2|nr:hypothetical protein [Actinomadura sp. OS1-43]MDL4817211.1 hypothetical protein [Actinomadura sp. OS1-43]
MLRLGAEALYGWTVGPVDVSGQPSPSTADNVHDLAAFGRYMARVVQAIEESRRRAPGGAMTVACRVVMPPFGSQIPLADRLIPRQIAAGVLGRELSAMLVRADHHGNRRPIKEHYPPELRPTKGPTGGRPGTWGPCEARRGERDHERAAHDIAGGASCL